MSKSVFISHNYKNSDYIKNLKQWEQKGYFPGFTFTYDSGDDKRHLGKPTLEEMLDKTIQGVTVLLVFIGQDTHNKYWIEFEVKSARKHNKKICCIEVPPVPGGAPKYLEGLERIKFNPEALRSELKRLTE